MTMMVMYTMMPVIILSSSSTLIESILSTQSPIQISIQVWFKSNDV